jgi:hypothetical protein
MSEQRERIGDNPMTPEEQHKYQPPSNEAITEQAEALCKGMYENHEANLNQWAAKFLGAKRSFPINPTHYEEKWSVEYYDFTDGTKLEADSWNPCQDRNQCWLVLDRLTHAQANSMCNFLLGTTNGAWKTEIGRVLFAEPTDVLQAAKQAVEDQE